MRMTGTERGASARSRWPLTLAFVVWMQMLTACGSDSVPTAAADPSPTGEGDIQLACTNLPFPADRLLVHGAENEPGPAADALRAKLATGEGFISGLPFPKTGWTRAVDNADEVQFVAFETRAIQDPTRYLIDFQLRDGRWTPHYTGECRLHAAAMEPGFAAGEWWLAQAVEPEDRKLAVVVREGGCTTDPARPERIGTPIVAPRGDVLKLVIPVRSTDDGTCTGATPLTIDIGQPIGARRILDAGPFPAREVSSAP